MYIGFYVAKNKKSGREIGNGFNESKFKAAKNSYITYPAAL